VTPAEFRRLAREAEARGQFAVADRLRWKADAADPEAPTDPLDLRSLTMKELLVFIDDAFARGMAASAELARREGDR